MAFSALTLLITLTAIYHVTVKGDSDYDVILDERCSDNKIMTGLNSTHSNYYEDRVWHLMCTDFNHGNLTNCEFPADYANDYDEDFDFACPSNKVMTGIYGIHKNYYEDRRFKFLCCNVKDIVPVNCMLSNLLNDYDGPLNFHVPNGGQVITGISSVHKNYQEDRRFRVRYCELGD